MLQTGAQPTTIDRVDLLAVYTGETPACTVLPGCRLDPSIERTDIVGTNEIRCTKKRDLEWSG